MELRSAREKAGKRERERDTTLPQGYLKNSLLRALNEAFVIEAFFHYTLAGQGDALHGGV